MPRIYINMPVIRMWVRSQDGRLTRTLMREGKAGDEFWTKAETLLYTALIGYIQYNSDGAKLKEVLKRFNQEQGYNSVFIPAMRKLSPAYDEYVLKLQKADQAFSQRYQQ